MRWSSLACIALAGRCLALPNLSPRELSDPRRWWDSTAKVTPCTVVLDGDTLVDTKLSLRDNSANESVWDSYDNLLAQADTYMDSGELTLCGSNELS